MAKSTRSKVKRQYRAKKREEGVYAAVEAARLERLSAKLVAIRDSTKISPIGEGDSKEDLEEEERMQQVEGENNEAAPQQSDSAKDDGMDLDQSTIFSTGKISTHGPRNSRREQWRASKGMPARAKSKGMNRQGGISAKHRAGRPKRRR